jgi:hypothetical protein
MSSEATKVAIKWLLVQYNCNLRRADAKYTKLMQDKLDEYVNKPVIESVDIMRAEYETYVFIQLENKLKTKNPSKIFRLEECEEDPIVTIFSSKEHFELSIRYTNLIIYEVEDTKELRDAICKTEQLNEEKGKLIKKLEKERKKITEMSEELTSLRKKLDERNIQYEKLNECNNSAIQAIHEKDVRILGLEREKEAWMGKFVAVRSIFLSPPTIE